MSGIAGFIRWDGAPADGADLQRMLGALTRLGPDRKRHLTQGPLALGHVLMQVTPDDRIMDQPASLGPLVGVVASRLDNRPDLLRSLGVNGDEARRLSDADIVLRGYAAWGDALPERLLGDFSLAIWDSSRHRLFCACDHFAMQSLYYHAGTDFFAFASTPSALFALPEVPRRLNEAKLADFLVLLNADIESSLYDAIGRVPGGHRLTVDGGRVSVTPYWILDSQTELRLGSDEAYVEAFREIFDEAVACRLRSSHPIGVMLSGGLDSATVAAAAARQMADRGKRLTAIGAIPRTGASLVSQPGWVSDEAPFMEAVAAAAPNMDLVKVAAEARRELTSELDSLFFCMDSPLRNVTNRHYFDAVMQEAQRRGIRVMLSGGGGNLTMSWDGKSDLFSQLLRSGRWTRLLREIYATARRRGEPLWRVAGREIGLPLLPDAAWKRVKSLAGGIVPEWRQYSSIDPRLADQVDLDDRFRRLGWDPHYRQRGDFRRQRIHILTKGALVEAGTMQRFWRARYGIEHRDPTLDKRVVEFCLALPPDQYYRHGAGRSFIRRVMSGMVPDSVTHRAARGIQGADWVDLVRESLPQLRDDLERLRRPGSPVAAYVDLERMGAILDRFEHRSWVDRNDMLEFETQFARGMMVARFIDWFERSN